MSKLQISAFPGGARDNTPRLHSLSWDDLLSWMVLAPELPADADKTSLEAWSPCWYPPNARRGKASVVAVSLLVLDYDEGETIEDAVSIWGRWQGCFHTSWSHTEATPKFRIVLPLAEPVEAKHWGRAWTWAASFAGRTIDPKCKDASRLYFLPAWREGYPRGADSFGGRRRLRIPWESIPQPVRRPAVPYRPPAGAYPASEAARLRRQALTHPDVRLDLAHNVGGSISGNRVSKVRCPSCNRRSVWWLIEPERMTGARCNHEGSCGWRGSLVEVAHVAA